MSYLYSNININNHFIFYNKYVKLVSTIILLKNKMRYEITAVVYLPTQN